MASGESLKRFVKSLYPGLRSEKSGDIIFTDVGYEGVFMKKLFFVMNPAAGMRKANKLLPEILAVFNRAGYQVMVHITAAQGDALQTVRQCAGEMDLIVCCGGDGTFNETVAGLLQSGKNVPLGYIPAGSTNDFAGSLGLPGDPVQAAKQIVTGTARYYDVGCFGGRYFTYVASFGAFTKASYTTPQNIKNALGHTAYLLEGIQELSQLKSVHVRLETDSGVIEDDFLFGAVCNSTSVGGILTLDPSQVDMCDGYFELLLVRAPKEFSEIAECIQAVQRQKYSCRMITFCKTRKAVIHTTPSLNWTLDGEKEPGHSTVEVQNLHKAFRLVR